MRKGFVIPVAVLAASLTLAGCKKKKAQEPVEDEAADTTAATGGTGGAATGGTGDTQNTGGTAPTGAKGSITGSVSFTGTAPTLAPIKPDKDPSVCGASIVNESVIVNPNKTLKNVVVRVVSDAKVPAEGAPLVLDQQGCRYIPHVSVATMGQKIQAKSSDATIMHNVHTYVGEGDAQTGLDNISQPPGSAAADLQQPTEPGVLLVKCDVHPWMTSYVVVSSHPWATVTGDDGSFKLDGVPAGKHTLEAWHETFGKKTIEVEVAADKPASATFEYKGDEKP